MDRRSTLASRTVIEGTQASQLPLVIDSTMPTLLKPNS